MDKDEYKNRLVALFNDYEFNRKSIMREYALSKNEIEIGNVFIDHIGPILVEKIDISYSSVDPECIYFGIELKKDYTFPTRIIRRWAYQTNQCGIIK